MDTGASYHMTANQGTLSSYFNMSIPRNIIVGNGHTIPIRGFGHASLPSSHYPLRLKNLVYAPQLVKNLISVCRLAIDNHISINFDPFGFTMKEYPTGKPSIGDLYPLTSFVLHQITSPSTFAAFSQDLWHHRLGHSGVNILHSLNKNKDIQCNKSNVSYVYESCIFGKQTKLLLLAPYLL